MTARAIWKGTLKTGSLEVPVKLYSAVEDKDVHFHVLQSGNKTRIRQQMVTDEGHEAVAEKDIRKGYELEPGKYVVLDEADLDRLKPKASRVMTITRFVPLSEVGSEWFERPYYLGPDGDESRYFAFVEALDRRHVQGIVRWTMRGKSYVGSARAESGYLGLVKMRYAEEVLPSGELKAPGGVLDRRELHMARELLAALEGTFTPDDFRDEYRGRLEKFIAAKAKGGRPRLPQVQERSTAAPLQSQLAKSLAALKRKGAKVA